MSAAMRALTLIALVTAVAGCGSGNERPDTRTLQAGRSVFVRAGCGGCHTLRAAGAHGDIGPNFNTSERLSTAQIRNQLDLGIGGMPSFRGRLTARQEAAVAAFLADAMKHRTRR
jgi:mono/diheme cytochrome c family protein